MAQLMRRWEARVQHRGQQDLILLLLEKQGDPLPEPVPAQVESLPAKRLAGLGLALLHFSDLSDLTRWLNAESGTTR